MQEKWDVLTKTRELTGKIMDRGWLKPGQFHLIVNVWIKNSKNEYLISKRTGNKRWPNLWGCTIGSAVTGDNSLKTALKETKEELGLDLDEKNAILFKEYINYVTTDKDCGEFIDVWIFNEEVDLTKTIFQEEETCDAKWATKEEILQLMETGQFIPLNDMIYFNELK